MSETIRNNSQEYEDSWANFSMREMPTASKDRATNFYINEIRRRGNMEKVARFIDDKEKIDFKIHNSPEDFLADNPEYQSDIGTNLSADDKNSLREYTGFRFSWINSAARGIWDYEKLGKETPEAIAKVNTKISSLRQAISKAPAPNEDFLTFRGTNLDSFKKYGVQTLSDLEAMKGQFYLEKGFTSTALVREKSFADRDVSDLWIEKSDIELRFHISAGASDIVALLSSELSYYPDQTEVLINKNSLSYVQDVSFEQNGHAVVDLMFIPPEVYN